jgi:hypothetical protein
VRRTLLAAVLAAGAVTALAAFAQQPQTPATQSPSPAPAANPPMFGMEPDRGMPEGMMRRRMMMHRMMAWRDPKEACLDRLARRAGRLAYVGAKLNLTAQQQPLWDKIQTTANDEAAKERQLCQSMKPRGSETTLDRLTRMEDEASARLAGLKAAIPEVQQLYQALTPAQREILDHPFRR